MTLVRQLTAATLLLAILWAGIRIFQKKCAIRIGNRKSGQKAGFVKSCGRLSLGTQHSLHCVRVGGRHLVLGVHPTGMTVLCEIAAGEEGE